MRAGVAPETRVCAYDRADLVRSEARPPRRSDRIDVRQRAPEIARQRADPRAVRPLRRVARRPDCLSHTFRSERVSWPDLRERARPRISGPRSPETLDIRADAAQLVNATLGDRPVVVLDSDGTGDGAALARRSTNSMWVNAPGIGHGIPSEAPRLAVEAIRLVVTSVRTGARLPPCAQTPLPNVGGRCESLG